MARFPRVFPVFYRILIRAGEESGRLGTVMQRLAGYLEARGELATQVGLAFIYPAVVLGVSLLVLGFLALCILLVGWIFKTGYRLKS